MVINFVLLIIFLLVLIKTADWSIRYSTLLAEGLNLSKFVIGYMVVAIISILPETFISLTAAFDGVPEFGLGTLLGSNVADLTLVIALIIFFSGHALKVESKIINNGWLQIGILLVPLILGFDGQFTRLEGVALLVAGIIFYYFTLKGSMSELKVAHHRFYLKNLVLLVGSMICLMLSAKWTVDYGVNFAHNLGINPLFVGMFIVALGTTLPEMMFSVRAAKRNHDSLAIGDILGTVTADATIVVGLLAVVSPFVFPQRLIYITGGFMMLAMMLLFRFMKTGKQISKIESLALFALYLLFLLTEIFLSKL